MAAPSRIHRHLNNEGNSDEIKAAIAKAVELRAIHAALLQGTSPNSLRRLPPPSLSSCDYPVFTPTYEDDDRSNSQFCNYYGDHQEARSVTSSCTNLVSAFQTSPAAELMIDSRRRRNSLGDFKSVSSKLGFSDADSIANQSSFKHSNMVVPLTDSHVGVHSQQKSKKMIFSRLFSRLTKKKKANAEISISSPIGMQSEGFSQVIKDFGAVSVDALRKELIEANRERDVALSEVEGMRSSFGDLRKKLDNLENYCEELKRALRERKPGDGGDADALPVCKEVMSEGFLQIVSEARLSVKHFCKTLVGQINETDDQLIDNLDTLLKPHKLSLLGSKYSKAVSYHLEAIVNETLHQDFENCSFERNGSPKLLDPRMDREAKFLSFVALRNLSWSEVMGKGTKYYSEDFSKFCDQKMSSIIATLNWIRPWSEQLLESFFVAAKCVWLLHLLAFSCYPPLAILRVEENRVFDRHYMDDILTDRQKRGQEGSSRVKVMVMPGFYVQDKILRCTVLCRYKHLK